MTQRLKLEPSPISQTHVDKVFSPVCECATSAAHIDFSIRRADHLRIWVRTPSVPQLVADRDFPKGMVHVQWAGKGVPDGTYFAVVKMSRAQRTIDLPNPIRIDTTPPTITLVSMHSTEGKTRFFYRSSEQAHALLFVNGRRAVRTYSTNRRGKFDWQHVPKRQRLVLVAEDVAGNRSAPVRISY